MKEGQGSSSRRPASPSVSFERAVKKDPEAFSEDTRRFIRYFLRRRELAGHPRHRKLRLETWRDLAAGLWLVDDGHGGEDLSENQLKAMIDAYLAKTYRGGCDYSLAHFSSEGVKRNLMWEEAYD